MRLTKKLAALGVATLMAVSVVGCSSATENEKTTTVEATEDGETTIVATVNGVEITSDQVDSQMLYAEQMAEYMNGPDFAESEEGQMFLEQQRQMIINYLIEDEVFYQQVQAFDSGVSQQQIEEELALVKADFETDEAYQEALVQNNLTEEQLKKNIESNLRAFALQQDIIKDVEITDEDVQSYYNQNVALYTESAGAEMFHILVETEEEAKRIKEEYEAGTAFGDLAAQYGTDGTKDMGGALGFIAYNDPGYDADFLAGAKEVVDGEVSDPVATQFGYHLIKVENITQETVLPFEEVEVEVRQAVEEQEYNTRIQAQMTEWIEAADIVIIG